MQEHSELDRLAAAAGATQLGEAPGCHWLFNLEQLEAFLRLIAEAPLPKCPI